MTSNLSLAATVLLEPAGLSIEQLQTVLAKAMRPKVDWSDIYLQESRRESWFLEDGQVKSGDYSIEKGFGFRVVSGVQSGYAYADNINLQLLNKACRAASSIVQSGACLSSTALVSRPIQNSLYLQAQVHHSLSDLEKITLLEKMDARARAKDPRVNKVCVRLSGVEDIILIAGTDGMCCADQRPLVRLQVTVVVADGGRTESGTCGGGGRYDYTFFDESTAYFYVDEAVRIALLNLDAVVAPAGTMPVVLGSGWPGVLLHEAVGHGLEADACRKGCSAFSGLIGAEVASPLCTIVDDGTLPNQRGSLNIDDEGVPTQCTTLIAEGVCVAYMQDRLNASLLKQQPTGNGRRESYAFLPMPRMTNTYLLPGTSTEAEMIGSIKKGLFAVDFAGGQVDTTTGQFVFSTSEAYLIENGRVIHPVKGATLMGNGPEVLKYVSMVGNNLAMDRGTGICGKNGQSVPVSVGQPSLKVDQLLVGGQVQ